MTKRCPRIFLNVLVSKFDKKSPKGSVLTFKSPKNHVLTFLAHIDNRTKVNV